MIPVDGSLLSRPLERYQPGKLCCEMLASKPYIQYIYIVWHYIYKRIHTLYIYMVIMLAVDQNHSCGHRWPLRQKTPHFIFRIVDPGSPNATDPSLVNPHLGGDSSEVQESPELRTVTAKTSNSPYHVNLKPISQHIYIYIIYMYNMYKPSLYHHLQLSIYPSPFFFRHGAAEWSHWATPGHRPRRSPHA